MIEKLVLKLVVPIIRKMFFKMFDEQAKIFKFSQSLDYMELENSADREIAKLKEQMKMVAKDIHPPAIDLKEWKELKADMKKIKKLRVFKSIG